MEITVSDAKAQLTELVRRAEEGEDVVLTRHGKPVARLQPMRPTRRADRRGLMEALRNEAPPKAEGCVTAARSQDFLYDEDGLPK